MDNLERTTKLCKQNCYQFCFLLTVCSLPVYADQTEELPDTTKRTNTLEKQELNNNAPKEAPKELPLA